MSTASAILFSAASTTPEAKHGWLLRLKLDKSGVLAWETLAAQIDDAGTPWPVNGAFTPCGRGDDERISECQRP